MSSSAVQPRPTRIASASRGVLVDDVGELEPAAVAGLVELKVDRPHMVRPLRAKPLGALGTDAAPLAGALRRPLQAFFSPEALHTCHPSRRITLAAIL
jgi:hypothetical protein